MNNSTTQPLAAGQAAQRIITIGDKTGTLYVNGEPTGMEVRIFNESKLTRAELMSLLNPAPATLETREIGEIEVTAFFARKVAEYAPQFPGVRDFRIENCRSGFYVMAYIGDEFECVQGNGKSIDAAVEEFRQKFPDTQRRADKLRAEAQKLLDKAAKLTATAEVSA